MERTAQQANELLNQVDDMTEARGLKAHPTDNGYMFWEDCRVEDSNNVVVSLGTLYMETYALELGWSEELQCPLSEDYNVDVEDLINSCAEDSDSILGLITSKSEEYKEAVSLYMERMSLVKDLTRALLLEDIEEKFHGVDYTVHFVEDGLVELTINGLKNNLK